MHALVVVDSNLRFFVGGGDTDISLGLAFSLEAAGMKFDCNEREWMS